jgi:stearoyl-CoA desaturase (delta-9 desaturase)
MSRSTLAALTRLDSIPFVLAHFACLLALFTPFTAGALMVCLGSFWLRMFALTGGYHRYFAHRSFKTSRVFQFVLALLGTTAAQKGVLWWAANHRNHHKYSDQPEDIHSPVQTGFWWAHMGWILSPYYDQTDLERIPDMAKYPELRWLNEHFLIPPVALAVSLYLIGGMSWLVWGFFVSTVALWHATFTINSLAHVYGSRRYETTDTSRNNLWLALLTFGEGWHNNHHYFMNSTRQGFFWWEIDITYYVLKGLSSIGVTWDLIEPPRRILQAEAEPELKAA